MSGVTAEETAIRLSDFSFAIGGRPILRGISFTVGAGEYLSVIGPNGAGKTTLLRCLDRIHRGGRGRIEVFGQPLGRYSQRRLARLMSYVPQADGRGLPFTVEQFVLMGRYPYFNPLGGVGREDRLAVADALERTGIGALASRRLDTLSGGERQTVHIAAALAQGARVLLLDEPTTFLDYRHEAEIRELLRRLNRQSGVTIVSVTHDVNRAVLDSDRIVAIREGEVVFCGPAAEVMDGDVLRRIYDTSFLLVDHPQARLRVVIPPASCGPA